MAASACREQPGDPHHPTAAAVRRLRARTVWRHQRADFRVSPGCGRASPSSASVRARGWLQQFARPCLRGEPRIGHAPVRPADRRRPRRGNWLFARQDTVEAAWRIVEPVLEAGAVPVHPYAQGTWGPKESDGTTHGQGLARPGHLTRSSGTTAWSGTITRAPSAPARKALDHDDRPDHEAPATSALIAEHEEAMGRAGHGQSCWSARAGSMDWFCSPRFDVYRHRCSELCSTPEKGGHCTITAKGPPTRRSSCTSGHRDPHHPLPLRARMAEVVDFVDPGAMVQHPHGLVRMVTCICGASWRSTSPSLRASTTAERRSTRSGSPRPVRSSTPGTWTHAARRARARRPAARPGPSDDSDIHASSALGGETGASCSSGAHDAAGDSPMEIEQGLTETAAFWQAWVGRSTYRGRWRDGRTARRSPSSS